MPRINGAEEVFRALGGMGPVTPLDMQGSAPGQDEVVEGVQRPPRFSGTAESYLGDAQGVELAARVEALYEESYRARQGRERMWFESLAFYAGQHYCVWDAGVGGGPGALRMQGQRPSWSIRRTLNKIKSVVQHAAALVSKVRIDFKCKAPTSEGEDVMRSEASDAILTHYRRLLRYDRIDRVTLKLMCILGTVGHEIEWNPTGGGQELDAAQLGPEGVGGVRPVGRPMVNILTPFNLVHDPKATGDDDGEFLFTVAERDIQRIAEMYPDAAPYLRDESIGHANDGMNYLIQYQDLVARYNYGADSMSGGRRSLLLKTLYLPRSLKWPQGRRIITANYTLLHDGPNPIYTDPMKAHRFRARAPVFIYRWDYDGIQWFGHGLVPDLIDPQRQINRLVSKAEAIIHTMANPKWVLPSHHEIKVTDKPGEVIRYPLGSMQASDIQVIKGSDLPQSVFQLVNLLEGQMEEIAGIRSATAGEAPSARSSGRQIGQLIEQDASRISSVREDYGGTAEEEMRYVLECVRRYEDPNHLIQVTGENHASGVQEFTTADILEGTDVEVVQEGRLPQDPEARALILNQLAQNGYLQPQLNAAHREIGLRAMNLGNVRQMQEELDADTRKAERENVAMARGFPPEAEAFDDHAIHLAVVTNYMKSERFRRLPEPAQQQFRAHAEWHNLQLLQRMQSAPQGPAPAGAPGDTGATPGAAAETGVGGQPAPAVA